MISQCSGRAGTLPCAGRAAFGVADESTVLGVGSRLLSIFNSPPQSIPWADATTEKTNIDATLEKIFTGAPPRDPILRQFTLPEGFTTLELVCACPHGLKESAISTQNQKCKWQNEKYEPQFRFL